MPPIRPRGKSRCGAPRDEAHVVPPLVGPQDGDERRAERGDAEGPGNGAGGVGRGARSRWQEEDGADHGQNAADLENCEDVLRESPALDAEEIDRREETDRGQADRLRRRGRKGDEPPDVDGQRRGQRRDGSRRGDGEKHPAAEKARRFSPRPADEGVKTSGPRHRRSELGQAHRSQEREEAADDPNREHGRGSVHGPRDLGRHEEDARPDHGPNDQHDRVEEAQRSQELRPGRRFRGSAHRSSVKTSNNPHCSVKIGMPLERMKKSMKRSGRFRLGRPG